MPAEFINSALIADKGVESVLIMDDYGTDFRLTIPVSMVAQRAQIIADAITERTAYQTSIEAYATANGIDLSAQLAAGLAKKAKAKGN